MAAVLDRFYGTGRRKTSIARVWIKPGAGRIVVNRRAFEDYFPRETLRMIIAQPFEITATLGQFDVVATVAGGGPTGQARARVRLDQAVERRRDVADEGLNDAQAKPLREELRFARAGLVERGDELGAPGDARRRVRLEESVGLIEARAHARSSLRRVDGDEAAFVGRPPHCQAIEMPWCCGFSTRTRPKRGCGNNW